MPFFVPGNYTEIDTNNMVEDPDEACVQDYIDYLESELRVAKAALAELKPNLSIKPKKGK
jgi:hypothetical protein